MLPNFRLSLQIKKTRQKQGSKSMAFKSLQQKRQFVNGQAAVLDTNGIQRDKAFTFKTTHQEYHHDLICKKCKCPLKRRTNTCSKFTGAGWSIADAPKRSRQVRVAPSPAVNVAKLGG